MGRSGAPRSVLRAGACLVAWHLAGCTVLDGFGQFRFVDARSAVADDAPSDLGAVRDAVNEPPADAPSVATDAAVGARDASHDATDATINVTDVALDVADVTVPAPDIIDVVSERALVDVPVDVVPVRDTATIVDVASDLPDRVTPDVVVDPCARIECAEPLVCFDGRCQDRTRTGTDTTWRVAPASALVDWTTPGYDDGHWAPATAMGPWNTWPWTSVMGVASDSAAQWVWLGEGRFLATTDMTAIQVRGYFARPYRQVRVTVTSDNAWRVWIDGRLVGGGELWTRAATYVVEGPPSVTHVVAVEARNTGGPAGVLVDIR